LFVELTAAGPQPKALRKSTALLMLPAALVIFTLPIVIEIRPLVAVRARDRVALHKRGKVSAEHCSQRHRAAR